MISRLFCLLFARAFSPLASLLLVILVARFYGITELGQFQTILVWLSLFQFMSLFGMAEYIAKTVGEIHSGATQYVAHGLLFGVVLSCLCALFMFIGANFSGYHDDVKQGISVSAIALPFVSISMIFQAVFTAFEKIKHILFLSLTENLLIIILCAVCVYSDFPFLYLVWVLVISRIIVSIMYILTSKNIITLDFNIDYDFYRSMIPTVVVYGLTGVAFQIYMRIDIVMLGSMTNMSSVGLYSAASKLWEMCLMFPIAFYVLNLPVFARGYHSFPDTIRQKIEGHAQSLFIFIFFIFGFVFLFSESILSFVYGASFTGVSWVLRILILSFLIQSAEMILGMSCQAAGLQNAVMRYALFRAAVNIILNLILIPFLGIIGAALATLLSILLSFFAFHLYTKTALHDIYWIGIVKKPFFIFLLSVLLTFPLLNLLNYIYLWIMFIISYCCLVLVGNGRFLSKIQTG